MSIFQTIVIGITISVALAFGWMSVRAENVIERSFCGGVFALLAIVVAVNFTVAW